MRAALLMRRWMDRMFVSRWNLGSQFLRAAQRDLLDEVNVDLGGEG